MTPDNNLTIFPYLKQKSVAVIFVFWQNLKSAFEASLTRASIRICCGALSLVLISTLVSCASSNLTPDGNFKQQDRWVLLPINNLSSTPLAAEKAEALLRTQLQNAGLKQLAYYPELAQQQNDFPSLNYQKTYQQSLNKAQQDGFQRAISGDVVEWRYKSGLDGEPVVTLNLRVIDVGTSRQLWSASVSRSGWGFQSLGNTAHKVIEELVDSLSFE